MKFVMTFVWAFILGHVVTYVIGSMNSIPYDFATASFFGVVIFILVSLIGTVSSPQPADE
ncbi:YjzD family protein [Lederbergia sp. NSJ-179]|uniref:YjzD family protein n=1 Tax=Lederbergia sp. NSJ-179 TaxID=2931402 RepID=UPI001FD3FF9D|nr:YjzD family protein [Lederbergia sp. NSJ-179]MCJ7840371.1 YjzD family protein [Lederbergia sp. NSJ-179]